MKKNRLTVVMSVGWLLGALGCDRAPRYPGALQGVVELDERDLAFEFGGRLATLAVDEGARVEAGAVLAALDPALQDAIVAARGHELAAARAQLALLEAGPRGEDIRAMRARLEAARATEVQLASTLARHRALAGGPGATPAAAVDEIDARHRAAIADRQSIEQQLAALRSGARAQELAAADARAQAAQAAVDLELRRRARFELRTPIAGEVLDVLVEAGETISPGVPVVTIADPRHPYTDVFVPEAAMAGVRVGAAAAVHVDAFAEPLTGRVEHISRRTEFTPRFLFSDGERPNLVVRVRVRIDDPAQALSAGLPAFVYLDTHAPSS